MPHEVVERERRARSVWIVRDIVEVVAIVAAGIWAFYTFVYENRIKPSFADPELNFIVTMEKLGRHDSLVGIRLHTEIHNVGTVQANLVGLSFWVVGKRVVPERRALPPVVTHNTARLRAFYRETAGVPVFGDAYLTNIGDARSQERTQIQPGGNLARDEVFFVPAGRFDYLQAHMSARFTKENRPTPTTITFNQQGIPVFNVPPDRTDLNENSAIPSQLDLNAK
jgi:hypothetical protein